MKRVCLKEYLQRKPHPGWIRRLEIPEAERGDRRINGRWLLSGAPNLSIEARLRQDSPVIATGYTMTCLGIIIRYGKRVLNKILFARKE